MKKRVPYLWMSTLLIISIFCDLGWADDQALKNKISEIADDIELDRDASAVQFTLKETANIKVCRKTLKQAQRKTRGKWQVHQGSQKFRNPKHKPNEAELIALKKFKENPRLSSYWQRDEKGFWYFRQIRAETKCLKCHGIKSKRPGFIVNGYPNDRSFGFKDGDLMGVLSILKKD